MIKEQEYIFKIAIVGDQYVGKSCVLKRLAGQQLPSGYVMTIGFDFTMKKIHIVNKSVKLSIWDTCHIGKYMSITTSYIKDVDGILVVYDITNKQSFNNIKYWVNILEHYGIKDRPIIVFGNKADLEEKREINKEKAEKYCQKNKFQFYETSAKNSGDQINQALINFSANLIARKDELQEKQRLDSLQQQQNQDEAQKDENSKSKQDLASLKVEIQDLKQLVKNKTDHYKSDIQNQKFIKKEVEIELKQII